MSDVPAKSYVIRSFTGADQAACTKLYFEGLLGGRLAENDTASDLDDIAANYIKIPGSHFWVAHLPDGQLVGMIGVQHHENGIGEIRRLRVSTQHRRRGIGSSLMETALRFCQERNDLKVTLDTFMDREPAVRLFEKFRFRHSRTKQVDGRELLYFYLDLYMGDDDRGDPGS